LEKRFAPQSRPRARDLVGEGMKVKIREKRKELFRLICGKKYVMMNYRA
jgi:hypothetical protein